MQRGRTFPRTFEFDENLLTQLNDLAGRNGQILEYWLPEMIKDVLLPTLHEKGIVGLEHLTPGTDFPYPFKAETYEISNLDYSYDLIDPSHQLLVSDSDMAELRAEERGRRKRSKDLRGQHNRFFPAILCVKVVAKYSEYGPMTTDEYYTRLRKHAYSVRLSLMKESKLHYRQRGPYDGLPGHRIEEKIRTAAKEQSSWKRFVRYFAEVKSGPGRGGLAQMLDLIRMDENGNVVLTKSGSELAMLTNPVLNSDEGSKYEGLQSPLSIEEGEFLLRRIEVLFSNEFEKMGEMVICLKNGPRSRAELLSTFLPIRGLSPSKASAELNGLMGRAIDLHLVTKETDFQYGGDRRSASLFVLNEEIASMHLVEEMINAALNY